MKQNIYSLQVNGRTITADFNDLADQASGSVMISSDNTVILATAVMSKYEKDGDFFPLTVDYEEKFYAVGQILGSQFTRREGRPSDEAILSGRIVDRTIRPLFDQYIRNEVQVVITVLSMGAEDPDVLGVIGSSLAVATSDIPWNGPVSAVRVLKFKDSEDFILNPSYEDRAKPNIELELVTCGKDGNINMIEVGSHEVSNELVMKALIKASEEIEKIQAFQKEIISKIGKVKKIIPPPEIPADLIDLFNKVAEPKLDAAIFSGPGKEETYKLEEVFLEEYEKILKERKEENSKKLLALASHYFEEKVNDIIHSEAVNKDRRPDGRKMDEIRSLFAKVGGISSNLHGSGIFYRGGTHVLSVTTLGGPGDVQVIDGMEVKLEKRFMHHYNFPPFSSGETGRMGGTNRRMIGHGNLAEKALSAVIPPKDIFPYTIRIVSESLASNGSTSMASVCAGTISLMDAGIPIKAPVAGIASGLMMESESKYKVLTDIQGPEDHHGDMDFKVAGTRAGITAVQMDVKVGGIPLQILKEAFVKAEAARLQILDVIEKEISAPRPELPASAPKILSIKINPDLIGLVIGSGGKTIKEIKEKTGSEITIEDDGTVYFTGKNGSAEKAKAIVEDMTKEYKKGEKAEATVVKIVDFGAFVKINGSSTEGLVHISEIAPFRVNRVTDLLHEGQVVPVIVKDIDDRGKISLSIKLVDPELFKKFAPVSAPVTTHTTAPTANTIPTPKENL